MYKTRCYNPIELFDSEIVPAPAEISNEMSKLPSTNVDEYGYEMSRHQQVPFSVPNCRMCVGNRPWQC